MSLSTLLGFLFGVFLFLGSVALSTDNYGSFLDLPSVMMVVGGTIAAAYMSYQSRYVNLALRSIWHIFKAPPATRSGLNTEILNLIRWAYIIQSKGMLALDEEVKKNTNIYPMLKFGLTLVISGYKPEEIKSMMETAVEAQFERETVPAALLKDMAANAPAFGMIGTLVGLVVMLQSMGGDMSALGAGLAVALLTTLYGVVVARLLCLPAAAKIQQREEIARFRNLLITEGLVMLAEKKTPRQMQDHLNSFLDPDIHFDIDAQLKDKPTAEPAKAA
ncbi:MAG: MotA/TolQ/ExbB proton channel family protein [Alphaproteobacteria bacterium]|nr:MotA/TolQ/ExbB proton channel family protein [Alphaproteobacteria bacterium]